MTRLQIYHENFDVQNAWFLERLGSARYFWSFYTGEEGTDDYAGIFVPYTYSNTFYPITPAVGAGACVYSYDTYIYAVAYEEIEGYIYIVLAKISLADGSIVSQSRIWKYEKTAYRRDPFIRHVTTDGSYVYVDMIVVGYYVSDTTAPFIVVIDKSALTPISVKSYQFTPQTGSSCQLTLIHDGTRNLYCAKIPYSSSVYRYWIGSFSVDGSGTISLVDGQRYTYGGYDLRFDETSAPMSQKYWAYNGLIGFFDSPAKYGYIGFDESSSDESSSDESSSQVLGLHYVKFGSGYYSTTMRILDDTYVGSASGYTDTSLGKSSFISAFPSIWFPDNADIDIDCTTADADYYHQLTDEDKFTFGIFPSTAEMDEVALGDMTVTAFEDMPTISYMDALRADLGATTLFQSYGPLTIPVVTNIELPDLAVQTLGYTYVGDNVYTLDYKLYCMHADETVSVYFEYGTGVLNRTTESNTGIASTTTGDCNTENTPTGYTYYYRAVAVDSAGRKAYGGIRTILGAVVSFPTSTLSRVGSIKHVYDRTTAGIPPKFYMEVNLGGLAPEYLDEYGITDTPNRPSVNQPRISHINPPDAIVPPRPTTDYPSRPIIEDDSDGLKPNDII